MRHFHPPSFGKGNCCMEPDPILVSNTREWLLRAQEDLDNAQHDLMATSPFVRDALFHCQQAVEKAMKALLTWHDSAFHRWHARRGGGRRHPFDGVCREVPISWRACPPPPSSKGYHFPLSASMNEPATDLCVFIRG